MKRILLVALAIGTLWFAARAAADALRSDEERIRLVFEAEVAAFNDAAVFSTLANFADDFRDTSGGFDRALLLSALRYAFLNRRDAEGAFRHRCQIAWDGVVTEIHEDAGLAEARFTLALFSGRNEDSPVEWEVDVIAKLQWRDGRWLITESKHTTNRGRRPW